MAFKVQAPKLSNPLASTPSVNLNPASVFQNMAKNPAHTILSPATSALGSVFPGVGDFFKNTFVDPIGNLNPFKDRTPFTPDSPEAIMSAVEKYMPQYESVLTPDKMLADKYKIGTPAAIAAGAINAGRLDTGKLAANQDALNALKARAMAQGDSPWLRMQLDKLGLEELSARDRAASQALSQSAQANAALAMRGGLQSGARERIATGGARDLSAARQAIGRDMATNRLNLGIADDQTKMQLLSQIPGMDLSFADQRAGLEKFNIGTSLEEQRANIANKLAADQFNTQMAQDAAKFNMGNTLGAVQDLNKFNLGKYGEQMKAFGAGKTSEALAKGGKK